MLNLVQFLRIGEESAILEALNQSQAVIEFSMDGHIQTANENFLRLTGYHLTEIQGQHHRIFVDPGESQTPAYRQFWDSLRAGQFQRGEFMRIARGGREIWIQACYNPVLDRHGKPVGATGEFIR